MRRSRLTKQPDIHANVHGVTRTVKVPRLLTRVDGEFASLIVMLFSVSLFMTEASRSIGPEERRRCFAQ